jgi:regulatory protein
MFVLKIMEGSISDLTLQKRNKERVNVFIDGEYAFSLSLSHAARLKIGQSLAAQEIDKLLASDQIERAKEVAYRYLTYRPRSSVEVERHLIRKGFEQPVVDQVIERLVDLQLINDRSFAEYWVEQRETFKPRSRRALRYELYQKGINQELIDEVVSQVDELEAARRAAKKKVRPWNQLTEDEFLRKLGGFLGRRGFNYEIIKAVSHELWEETG